MPAMRLVKPTNIMPLATIVAPADYSKVKNCWIDRQGQVIYAGYWQHEETARLIGYDDIDTAERGGLIHDSESSSMANGIPLFVHLPRKITDRQYDTIALYCEIHKIQNPILQRGY